jgi:hypothetical protein
MNLTNEQEQAIREGERIQVAPLAVGDACVLIRRAALDRILHLAYDDTRAARGLVRFSAHPHCFFRDAPTENTDLSPYGPKGDSPIFAADRLVKVILP